jgi:hypothetical protein
MDARNLIDAIYSGNKSDSKDAFEAAMQSKTYEAISSMKASVAKSMFDKALDNDEKV